MRCARLGPLPYFPSKLANVSGAAVYASPLPTPVRSAHYPYLKVVRYSEDPVAGITSCHWRVVHTTCAAQSAHERSFSILNPLFYINSSFHPVRPLSFESAPWQSSVRRPHRPTLDDTKGYLPWLLYSHSDHGLQCFDHGCVQKRCRGGFPAGRLRRLARFSMEQGQAKLSTGNLDLQRASATRSKQGK